MEFLVRWCRDLPCGLRTCAFGTCKRGGACMSRRGLSFDARFCRGRLFKAQNDVVSRMRECKLGAGLSTAHESPTFDNVDCRPYGGLRCQCGLLKTHR
jgi:hypothetical protein